MKLRLDHRQHGGGALYIEIMKKKWEVLDGVACTQTCDHVGTRYACKRASFNCVLWRKLPVFGFDTKQSGSYFPQYSMLDICNVGNVLNKPLMVHKMVFNLVDLTPKPFELSFLEHFYNFTSLAFCSWKRLVYSCYIVKLLFYQIVVEPLCGNIIFKDDKLGEGIM